MTFLTNLKKSIFAGLAISIGATVYMACQSKLLGAFLFTFGLMLICVADLNLYTGKIGYVFESKNKPNIFVVWLGNLLGTVLGGLLIRLAKPDLHEVAAAMIAKKFDMNLLQIFILATFCGVLMYVAVNNFKTNSCDFSKYIGLFVCVPLFIISGFEHSIANMVYCTVGISSLQDLWQSLLVVAVATVGNFAGAVIFRKFVK